ncbi:hypothetical protein T484DRAFT_1835459 [Baffinella frigidus]|nr:hypothetical protein T484DRAFT_1835459 [Cryptophyta sp. CCMP2293]
MLLEKGADVSLTTEIGCTALHYAVAEGRDAIVEAGADVCARNSSGRTPENLASSLRYQEGMDDIVALLRAEAERRTAEEERRAACEAFAMLDHERLGANSLGRRLDAGVVRMIMDLVW